MHPHLEAIRDYPLLDYDIDNVRVRAYYLSLGRATPAPLDDWFEAEIAELKEQAEWLLIPSTAPQFFDDFRVVDFVRFETRAPPTKRTVGQPSPRRCSLCGLGPAQTTFRTDAHLLPALTGSRGLLTFEECDTCNGLYGRKYDDHLGKMLLPMRALGRIPTRTAGSAKLKLRGGQASFIGGQARGDPLSVGIQALDDTVELRHIDANTMELVCKGMPYEPIAAIRSLARSAWHLMPSDLQAQNTPFLEWIRGERAQLPFQYYEAFVPGPGLLHTTFAVWVHKRDSKRVMFMFCQGNVVLLVDTPNWEDGTYSETPVPPLPKLPYGEPRLTKLTFQTDKRVEDPVATFELSFISRTFRSSATADPVVCEFSTSNRQVQFFATCSVTDLDGDVVRYTFSGGQLIGTLVIDYRAATIDDGEYHPKAIAIRYELVGAIDLTACDVAATHTAILAIAEGGRLVINHSRSKWNIIDAMSPRTDPRPDEEDLRGALEAYVQAQKEAH